MARTSGITPESILDVAEGVMLRKGLRRTSLGDIALAAGISKGTLYYHYSSKEALFFSVAARCLDRLSARMLRWAESVGDQDAVEDAIRAMLENAVVDERMARILMCFLQDALFGNARLKERLAARYAEWKRTLSAAIARMCPKGEKQSMVFSELLFSVLEGFAVRAALSQRPPDCGGLARALSAALAYA